MAVNAPPFQTQRRRFHAGNTIVTLLLIIGLAYLVYRVFSKPPTTPVAASAVAKPLPIAVPTSAIVSTVVEAWQKFTLSSAGRAGVSNEFTVTPLDSEHVTMRDAEGNTATCTLPVPASLEDMDARCKMASVAAIPHASTTGYHVDADGKERPNAPAGWLAKPDCKAQGLRVWVHSDPQTGDVASYYCAK